MTGCCEHGTEPTGPIMCGKFVNKLRNYWFLKKNLLHEFIPVCTVQIL